MTHIYETISKVCGKNKIQLSKGDCKKIAALIHSSTDETIILAASQKVVSERQRIAIFEQQKLKQIAMLRPIIKKAGLIIDEVDISIETFNEKISDIAPADVLGVLTELHNSNIVLRLAAKNIQQFSQLVDLANSSADAVFTLIKHGVKNKRFSLEKAALIVARGFGVSDTVAKEFGERIASLSADEKKKNNGAKLQRKQEREWQKTLIDIYGVCNKLSASQAEIRRWVSDGKLLIASRQKQSNGLYRNLYEPSDIATASGLVDTWREEWKNINHERRLAIAQDPNTIDQRRKKALLRSAVKKAYLNDAIIVPIGIVHVTICGSIIPLDLENTKISVEWPEDITSSHDNESLKGKIRQTAIATIQATINTAIVTKHAYIRELIEHWSMRVDDIMLQYPDSDQPIFVKHVRELLYTKTRNLSIPEQSFADVLNSVLANILTESVTNHAKQKQHEALKRETGLDDYISLFPEARSIRRRLIFNVGPTNSGKTHDAMERLAQASTGCYLAPLRLMALEASERLNAKHIPTDMITGEERILVENAQHVSSTIEMIDLEKQVDVAVIDEIQLIADSDRGWAWTQAIIGIPAKTVVMTGSIDALPFVVRIAEMTGDELEVINYERKVPLQAMKKPVNLSDIQAGDAVIAFSRKEVLRLRAVIRKRIPVAVVYGALSPEVRRNEARRFRSNEATVLIATDAIAMGLNLPVKRIIFSALEKYDGMSQRPLTASEIRQISGRAGRFGIEELGEAGILGGHGLSCDPIVKALNSPPEPPKDTRLYVMPPWRAVKAISTSLDTNNLNTILTHFASTLLINDRTLVSTSLDDVRKVVNAIANSKLPLRTRFSYLGCPVDNRNDDAMMDLVKWSRSHAQGQSIACPMAKNLKSVPETDSVLNDCEEAVKRLTAYLWLSMRWPDIYSNYEAAIAERNRLNSLIESALKRRAIARSCSECGTKIPTNSVHKICDKCYQKRRKARNYDRYDDWYGDDD